jgi:HlyD family secretion protein
MKSVISSIGSIALGASLLLASSLTSCGSKPEAKAADGPEAQKIAANNRITEVSKVVALGRVEPESAITELSMDVSGVVQRIQADDGANVKAGDAILEVAHGVETAKVQLSSAKATTQSKEVAVVKAQLRSARITVQSTKDKFTRAQSIFQSGAETQQNLDNAKADYETALQDVERLEASIASAESKLREFNADTRVSAAEVERRILRAPSEGTILKLEPNVGSSVTAGKSIGDFAPKGALTVSCEVDELFVNDVQVGQKATIRQQGRTETIADGEVMSVGAYLKKKSLFSDEVGALEDRRVREVRVRLVNANNLLLNSRVECVIQVK